MDLDIPGLKEAFEKCFTTSTRGQQENFASLTSKLDLVDDAVMRMELYRDMQPTVARMNRDEMMNVCLWAGIMVLPTSKLKTATTSPGLFVGIVGIGTKALLKTFLTKTLNTRPGSADRLRSVSIRRSLSEANLCNARDGNKCVVTGTEYPQACHIFPLAAGATPGNILRGLVLLHKFCDAEDMRIWKEKLVESDLDQAHNMVSLSGELRQMWDRAIIGFQPMGKGDGKLVVAVRFLPRPVDNKPKPSDAAFEDLVQSHSVTIRHADSGRAVVDGQLIEFSAHTTKTGVVVPVPDWDILQLQWTLIRMAAMAGAATGARLHRTFDSADEGDGEAVPNVGLSVGVEEWEINIDEPE